MNTRIRSVSGSSLDNREESVKKIIGLKLPVRKQVTQHGIYNSIIIYLLNPEEAQNKIKDLTGAKEIEIVDHNNRPNCMVAGFRPNRLNVIINDEGEIIQAFYDSF